MLHVHPSFKPKRGSIIFLKIIYIIIALKRWQSISSLMFLVLHYSNSSKGRKEKGKR